MRGIDVFTVVSIRMTRNAGLPRTERRLGVGVGRHNEQQACCIDDQQQGRKYSTGGDWHYIEDSETIRDFQILALSEIYHISFPLLSLVPEKEGKSRCTGSRLSKLLESRKTSRNRNAAMLPPLPKKTAHTCLSLVSRFLNTRIASSYNAADSESTASA